MYSLLTWGQHPSPLAPHNLQKFHSDPPIGWGRLQIGPSRTLGAALITVWRVCSKVMQCVPFTVGFSGDKLCPQIRAGQNFVLKHFFSWKILIFLSKIWMPENWNISIQICCCCTLCKFWLLHLLIKVGDHSVTVQSNCTFILQLWSTKGTHFRLPALSPLLDRDPRLTPSWLAF